MDDFEINEIETFKGEYKKILQCPLCTQLPLIGLSMDEQSNTFVETFCKGDGTAMHCCYISIQRFMDSIKKGINYVHKCAGCECILGDSLLCKDCKKSFCIDDGLYHKIYKECLFPSKKLSYYKQFEFNCNKHKYYRYKYFCKTCNKNICEKCVQICPDCKNHYMCDNIIENNEDEKENNNNQNDNKNEDNNNQNDNKNENNNNQNDNKNENNNNQNDDKCKFHHDIISFDELFKIRKKELEKENINIDKYKNKEEFKSLFDSSENSIKSEYKIIEYSEKEKWKNKFLKENQLIIELYEYIYDNYHYLKEINFYDENICESFERFQNFRVKSYISDPTNAKSSYENYLKGRDTKYDLEEVYLQFEELTKNKKENEKIKLFKEDIYQDGKFLGLFHPDCLSIISQGPYKLDDEENKEKRIVGKYFWNEGDYYIGLWDEQNLFHTFGEYYFKVGENEYDKYIGEFKNGEMDGKGIYIWSGNKEFYYGDWKKDKREGKGLYVWEDGYIYQGNFKDNQKNDENGYIFFDVDNIDNDIDYAHLKPLQKEEMEKLDEFKDFYYYKGGFKDDYRDGRGIILYKDLTFYEGSFELSKKNGEGELFEIIKEQDIIKQIPKYKGKWKDNKFIDATQYS